MKRFFNSIILVFVLVAVAVAPAAAREKMTGVNGIRFGWKYDKCLEVLGNPARAMTTPERNMQRQYSYAPARWGMVDWDNGLLDFYKDRLMQVGFSRTTAVSDMSAFDTAKAHLTDLFGEPSRLKDTDNNLLWRSANGNIAILQYVAEPSVNGGKQVYSTYLYFIDNKQVEKKARSAESYLRSLIN